MYSSQFLTMSPIELSWEQLKTNNWLSLRVERDLRMQLVRQHQTQNWYILTHIYIITLLYIVTFIMLNSTSWCKIGLNSFGEVPCGQRGFPGAYTGNLTLILSYIFSYLLKSFYRYSYFHIDFDIYFDN